jgi:hypothetical protein
MGARSGKTLVKAENLALLGVRFSVFGKAQRKRAPSLIPSD